MKGIIRFCGVDKTTPKGAEIMDYKGRPEVYPTNPL